MSSSTVRPGRSYLIGAFALAALVAVLVASPAVSAASTRTSIVMLREPQAGTGDPPFHRVFHEGNSEIEAEFDYGGEQINVHVESESLDLYYDLEFAAPRGGLLRPRVYTNAQRAPFRDKGRPGIDIGGNGAGCNRSRGSFEVKELVRGPGNTIKKLWILYEHYCEENPPPTYGEIRIEAPSATWPKIAPSTVRWPAEDPGRDSTPMPVTVFAGASTVAMTSATLSGPQAGDFEIVDDDCSGTTIPADGSCEVAVRFSPVAPGTRRGTLSLAESGGATHEVPLEGFAYGGTTSASFMSEPGDPIGNGLSWTRNTSTADFYFIYSSPTDLGLVVAGADEDDNTVVWLEAPSGKTLAPGTFKNAKNLQDNGSGPGMAVHSGANACFGDVKGEFTVTSSKFGRDGVPSVFGVSFLQRCDFSSAAFRGTIKVHEGDTTPRAPWMIDPPAPPCGDFRFETLKPKLGTSKKNRMVGGSGTNVLYGVGGADTLDGRGGADCLDGGAGADLVKGGTGDDFLRGGDGPDVLFGGAGHDVLNCGPGRDIVYRDTTDTLIGCEVRRKGSPPRRP